METINLCRVFHNEQDNPINKSTNEFAWYIWRIERKLINDLRTGVVFQKDFEEYFKSEIKSAIDLYADAPYGGDPTPFYEKYFNF